MQSSDFNYRNAIFHDLLNYDWPVIYGGEKGALVYYIGFWLPAASVGKLAGLFTHDATTIWKVANAALYVWTLLGVWLTFLLLFFRVRANNFTKVMVTLLVFLFFSGMDIIGFYAAKYPMSKLHLEWWTHGRFQFSSITTTLFWVFNQTVISWVTTLAMLQEKTPRYFVFLGIMCLFNGPLPFVGFLVLALARGIEFWWKNRKFHKYYLSNLFSIQNIVCICLLLPMVVSYFLCNRAVAVNGTVQVTSSSFKLNAATISYYIFFIFLEIRAFVLLLAYTNRKSPVFWAATAFLLVCPFIHVGSAADFCMRASIPGLLYLCTCAIRYLTDDHVNRLRKPRNAIAYGLLCVVLLIGAITPGVEFARGIVKAKEQHKIVQVKDSYKTLNTSQLKLSSVSNFVSPNYKETVFFLYFADVDIPRPSSDRQTVQSHDLSFSLPGDMKPISGNGIDDRYEYYTGDNVNGTSTGLDVVLQVSAASQAEGNLLDYAKRDALQHSHFSAGLENVSINGKTWLRLSGDDHTNYYVLHQGRLYAIRTARGDAASLEAYEAMIAMLEETLSL